MNIKTRFAPSPTGSFHMGSLRTAIYNYLFAKKNSGKFILRIEDTDKERSTKKYEQEIFDIFKIFDLEYDEIYHQSNNQQKHINYLDKLLEKGAVYKNADEPYRFKIDRSVQSYSYNDLILGKVEIPCENLEDFSIARSDKKPTFILSNLIDDIDNDITHVIRGNDHSINTIKQNLLSKALGFHEIQYAHIPLIHDLSGKKLSKRDNITNVIDYLNDGYLVQSIFNFIIKLGNNFNDLEFLNKQEAIKNFELNKIVRSPAKFDTQKLNFINNHYLKELSYEEFERCLDKNLLDRCKTFNIKVIFNEITERSDTTKNFSHEIEKLINTFINKIKIEVDLEEQNLINNIYEVIHNLHDSGTLLETLDKKDLNIKKIGKLMRKILVNFESKLPMDKILLFFGVSNLKERLILFKND